MKIQSVEFSNFRSFVTFALDLSGRSIFVIGANAGGKTSLLTGITRALGRDLNFSIADFADPSLPIALRITVTELDVIQRGVFANYADFSRGSPILQLETRATWNAMAEEADVEHGYPSRPGSRSRREERDAISLHWLPSSRDASRMLQFGVARNLMGQLLEALPAQADVDDAIEGIREASQQLGQGQAFEELLVEARTGLSRLLPDVSRRAFSLGTSAITMRDLLRQFELVVEYLGEPIAVSRQSSGIAQLSTFAFTMVHAASDRGTILIVDEPELSLHPQSQRALMRALRQLDCQMIVATHSSNLLDRADPRSAVRLRRSAAGIEVRSPASLSDSEAQHLARFTSPQTAEAFFARKVILVEGLSDQFALEAIAERLGRNLDADGVAIVPIGGARTLGTYLALYGPRGFDLELVGLCDEAEQAEFSRALARAGMGADLDRAGMEHLGFFVSVVDLEDELIRGVGTTGVEAVIDANNELPAFRTFQNQPAQRGLSLDEQVRAFVAARGRKVEYASLLADALDLARVPAPLHGILARV